jgi:hypothetical protein
MLLAGCTSTQYNPNPAPSTPINPYVPDNYTVGNFTVANWNLQIFGTTKAKDTELMNTIASEVKKYDIVFIQEIRDSSDTAFPALCGLVSDKYDCRASSRAGRSSSKEQYGVLYRKYITITNWIDYSPDVQDRWERPPLEVTFNIKGYNFTAFTIHTKPTDVPNEVKYHNLADAKVLASCFIDNIRYLGHACNPVLPTVFRPSVVPSSGFTQYEKCRGG